MLRRRNKVIDYADTKGLGSGLRRWLNDVGNAVGITFENDLGKTAGNIAKGVTNAIVDVPLFLVPKTVNKFESNYDKLMKGLNINGLTKTDAIALGGERDLSNPNNWKYKKSESGIYEKDPYNTINQSYNFVHAPFFENKNVEYLYNGTDYILNAASNASIPATKVTYPILAGASIIVGGEEVSNGDTTGGTIDAATGTAQPKAVGKAIKVLNKIIK